MAENEYWKLKGGSLTVEQAVKEFEVAPDFIMNAINIGKLEFRQGNTKGRYWTKILRIQLDRLIKEDPAGSLHLARLQVSRGLHKVNGEISSIKKMLAGLQEKKLEIETWLARNPMPPR